VAGVGKKNYLHSSLKVGLEDNTTAKNHSFVNLLVLPTLGTTFRQVRGENFAAEENKHGPLVILYFFDVI
jgi:hypothetical protein